MILPGLSRIAPYRAPTPPGSIFKLMMAVAGLENGMITPETTVTCTGGGRYYGEYKSCNAVHGTVNLEAAIGRSCNVYFYELGTQTFPSANHRGRTALWARRPNRD